MGLTSKAFSDIITFSRSSNATRVGPDGKIAYAPHNLIQRSQEFNNAYWTAVDASITANAIAAPDGTVTADKLIASAISSSGHRVSGPCGNPSATWTVSIYAKAGEYNRLLMATSNTGFIGFNLSTGAVEGSIGALITHYGITPVGNGWYRCYFGSSSTAAGTNLGIYPFNTTFTGASTTFTGDGTSGIYIWGVQSSQGVIPGDYTPTTSAAVYGPRFDYDPVTLAAKGLLIEEQRTNLVTYSEQFDNAAWTKGDITVTANTTTAPDGTTTAEKITESATNFSHLAYQSFSASATAYTVTVYAKAAERSWIYLRFDTDAPVISTWYNLSTGTVGTVGSGVTASITSVGNGWYRCTYTRTATATTQYAVVGVSNADGTAFYTGDGTSGVYVWGAQLEAGAFATSYIPTVASSVTRSADVASVNTLSPWFNAVEGTIFAQFDRIANVTSGLSSGFPRTVEFNDTTANERIAVLGKSSTYESMIVSDGGAEQANIDGGSTVSGNVVAKIAATYKVNDFAISLNGGAVATDTSGTLPTVTRMDLGYSNASGGYYINGHLRRIAYYPRRLTNAELQALTA